MDVVAIRLSLILLLVVYHALCIYTGAWDSPFLTDIDIPFYDYLGMLIHSFQLETMVFISGLLLGYNALKKPKALSFHSCVVKKAKRILLPCLLFGIIYYVMFYDLQASWYSIIWKLLNGCGHLWFLPMIFWCFALTYLITRYLPHLHLFSDKINKYKIILVIAASFSIFNPLVLIPLGLGSAGCFYIYFFIGFCLKSERLIFPSSRLINCSIAMIIFIISFLIIMTIRYYNIQEVNTIVEKVSIMVLKNICHTANALSAIFLIYSFANRDVVLRFLNGKSILVTLSGYCYGVYIYQQFILKILYYNTRLPLLVSANWLPWIATAVTVMLSLLLCHYSLKTRLGRFLIG